MVILLKQHAPQAEQERLLAWLRELGAEVRVTGTPERPFFCLTGDISRIDPSLAARFPAVEDVLRLTEPYPLCSRRLHPEPTVVSVGGARFGGGHFGLIAGPCAVESEEQIFTAARQAKAAGVCLLRGGAFKPRTSPYDFSGLGAEGLRLLIAAGHETGLPVVSELMSTAQLDAFADVDVIQIGARNMQNFDLLRALGRSEKPVLLKRGVGATLQELLLSAEYLLAAVDPSHAAGRAALVTPLALAAAACGADGVMVEMHPDPLHARCDGAQALLPEELAALSQRLHAVREACR